MVTFKDKLESNKGRHAYVEGGNAALAGLPLKKNPYKQLSKEFIEWCDGYLDVVFLGEL